MGNNAEPSKINKAQQSNVAHKKDLDNWNDRLDDNLEPEDHNDVEADQKAKEFSEKLNSDED